MTYHTGMCNMEVMGPQLPDPYARAASAASPPASQVRTPAAVLASAQPEVAVEDDGVYLTGTMYHAGLNKNAWGLSEQGARAIADSLVGADFTAGHPDLRPHPERGWVYDRALHESQGAPIGRVMDTSVRAVATAAQDIDDQPYTATYTVRVLDDRYRDRYRNGVYSAESYSVSVGIYAEPDDAVCNACGDPMADCAHDRGEEVESDDGSAIAGPMYDDGSGDHLAAVYLPAYDGATADVQASQFGDQDASAGTDTDADAAHTDHVRAFAQSPERDDRRAVLPASAALAAPFDAISGADPADDPADSSTAASSAETHTGMRVRVPEAATRSYGVALDNINDTPNTRDND